MQQLLSLDWGTTSFRLRLVNVLDKQVLGEITNYSGISAVNQEFIQNWPPLAVSERFDFYLDIIRSAIKDLTASVAIKVDGLPLIISGMASSAIGMQEIPYQQFPLDLNNPALGFLKIPASPSFNHEILIISGCCTDQDVLRGEETMIVGAFNMHQKDGLLIFPGTHSKHVIIENASATSFKTYMTGEVFDLLSKNSILSNTVVQSEFSKNKNAFISGVQAAKDGEFLNIVFQARVNRLFDNLTPEQNYHFLSGLVIGTEIRNIQADKIMLICGGVLENPYKLAIETLCPEAEHIKVDAAQTLILGQLIAAKSAGIT